MYSWNQRRVDGAAAASAFDRGRAQGGERVWHTDLARDPCDIRLADVVHEPGEARRREDERQRAAMAEQVHPEVDTRDVAQDARAELDPRVRRPAALQARLRAGPTVHVVEYRLGHPAPGEVAHVGDAGTALEATLEPCLGPVWATDQRQDVGGAGQASANGPRWDHGRKTVPSTRRSSYTYRGRPSSAGPPRAAPVISSISMRRPER